MCLRVSGQNVHAEQSLDNYNYILNEWGTDTHPVNAYGRKIHALSAQLPLAATISPRFVPKWQA